MKVSGKMGIMKKAIAVTLGITMAFGALALPGKTIEKEFASASASAYSVRENNITFLFNITDRTGVDGIELNSVAFEGDTLEIPSTITYEGVEYPVTVLGEGLLKNNKQIKTVIIPDSVEYIKDDVLESSSVEKIVLSNNLYHIGNSFARNSFSLSSIECTSTNLSPSEIGGCVLQNCFNMKNEKGAVCIGNCLIEYRQPSDSGMTELKIADLGNNGVKIDRIGTFAISHNEKIITVDLEGVVSIGQDAFYRFRKLKNVVNCDDLREVGTSTFIDTPWLEEAKDKNLVKLGHILMYYKTDDNVIDLTSGEFEDITSVNDRALIDCENIDTVLCKSDCVFGKECFHVAFDQESIGASFMDTVPITPTYNLKKIYIDGKELTYDLIWEDHNAYEWVRKNSFYLHGSAFLKDMVETKTQELFRQMDIPYYGMDNDMMGTHTPTEEFYIRLKIHNYLSQYPYDTEGEFLNETGAFLLGGKLDCSTYAYLAHYFLECTGIEAKTQTGYSHYWNNTKIGDEWFESDDGWNAQSKHIYLWFCQSTSRTQLIDPVYHVCGGAYDSYHQIPNQEQKKEPIVAERTLGDIDGDDDRDKDDAACLWAYVKGNSDSIDQKRADINFDEKVDLTDAVLLNEFVYSTALDINNIPTDGYATTVKVAFVNGTDYDNIKYLYTDREGYITLPADLFEAPEGKKLSYDVGNVGQKVRITDPLTVVNVKWIDVSEPDYSEPDSSKNESSSKNDSSSRPDDSSKPDDSGILGDVNGDRNIDIEDAVAIIQHINGMTPLKDDEEKRADVSKDKTIDIDDAVTLISYINGNSTF